MTDKSWMLNPQAIRRARGCIQLVKHDFGVSLKMSDPDFLQQLHTKVILGNSQALRAAYGEFMAMAEMGALAADMDDLPARPVVAAPLH